MKRKIFLFFAVVVIVCSMAVPAFARSPAPDFDTLVDMQSKFPVQYEEYEFDSYVIFFPCEPDQRILLTCYNSAEGYPTVATLNMYWPTAYSTIWYAWDEVDCQWIYQGPVKNINWRFQADYMIYTSADLCNSAGDIVYPEGYISPAVGDLPKINIDIDGDGVPDINIDTDGDGKADVNIDVDGDLKPDLNIDFNYGLNTFWDVLGTVILSLPTDVLLTISWLFAAFLIIGGIKLFN